MSSEKTSRMVFVPAAFSFLLSIGTLTVFHACEIKEDGTWMRCHEAEIAVVIGGLLLTALFLISGCMRNKKIKFILDGLGAVGAVILYLVPGILFQMCMMHTMRCYTIMQPFVRIMCALIVMADLYQMVLAVRK